MFLNKSVGTADYKLTQNRPNKFEYCIIKFYRFFFRYSDKLEICTYKPNKSSCFSILNQDAVHNERGWLRHGGLRGIRDPLRRVLRRRRLVQRHGLAAEDAGRHPGLPPGREGFEHHACCHVANSQVILCSLSTHCRNDMTEILE